MNRIIVKTGIFLMLVSFLMAGLFSCRKEDPTIAIITVVDGDGNVIPNASVHLYPEASINPHPQFVIDGETETDASGQGIFDYTDEYNLGQAGFALLQIEANSENTLFGEGIIKIEAEKTTYETIVAQPQ